MKEQTLQTRLTFDLQLLGTDRMSILAANLQVAYLLFEAHREHLKFQMEHCIIKLVEMVNSDSNRISYDQKELALGTTAFFDVCFPFHSSNFALQKRS